MSDIDTDAARWRLPFTSESSVLGVLLVVLSLWGCLVICASTVAADAPMGLAPRQFGALLLGVAAFTLAARIPFHWLSINAIRLSAVAFLGAAAVPWAGIELNGMRGWYAIGPLTLQPSELAKPFYLLGLASLCAAKTGSFKVFLLKLAYGGAWVAAVAIEPDFGSASVYAIVFLAALWFSKEPFRRIFWTALAGIVILGVAAAAHPYAVRRIWAFVSPAADPLGSGWHAAQLRRALTEGGFSGRFDLQSTFASHLPLPHSDSVFARIVEMAGLVGGTVTILLFILLTFYAAHIASSLSDRTANVFCVLLGCAVGFQAFLHISVNLCLIPPTGVTLPLISHGGSSLMATLLGFGILAAACANPKYSN